ncbi:surface carbohydrate biosynthesis protein [Halobacillus sp. A5]|uniref:surface carbohydrate biosynthesis protein n=1 Tax=Halobacillus sp. A5 TaxID=2880263 RepID=UPI0020A68AFA|nr:hypothetical protein [Halobacillus sp. A5]
MKAERKHLYLPIEIKARELDAKLLFSYYAVQEGYRVLLGEQRMVEEAAAVMAPGIFFSKGYSQRYRRRVIMNAAKANHKIVELDEEGFIFHDPEMYISERMNESLQPMIAQEYCWGDYQREVIVNAYPDFKKRCYLTGNPRFDLLKEKYRPLYSKKTTALRKQYGEFILINTRFALYNHFRGRRKVEEHSATAYIKKLYDAFLAMVKELSVRCPHVNIIIRPHPSEDVTSYQKAFSSSKNVMVRNDGGSAEWIEASRLVIHNGCTTGIEAALLGTPVVTYVPFIDARYDVEMPNNAGVKAYSVEEAAYYVNHKTKPKRTRFLSAYYEEEPSAHESILPLLRDLRVKSARYEPVVIPNVRNKNIRHRFSTLKVQVIRSFFKGLDEIEGKSAGIIIHPAGDNLFELTAKGK